VGPFTKALTVLKDFCEGERIPYVVIGAIATMVWGKVRVTEDVDIKVLLGERTMNEFYEMATRRFPPLFPDALAFFRRNYVLRVRVTEQVAADLIMAVPGYEELIFERAVKTKIHNVEVPVCSPEDLIIQKGISPREKDWQDIEGVLLARAEKLDHNYITYWLMEFEKVMDEKGFVKRYQALRRSIETPKRTRRKKKQG
jgi:hypothetical protein